MKTKKLEAGVYEVTTDAETYLVRREGGEDGIPIYWNIFQMNGRYADAMNTFCAAKWLIGQWETHKGWFPSRSH